MAPIDSLQSVEFNVTDLERSTKFYTDIWALERIAESSDGPMFRASGSHHHVLTLKPAEEPGLAAMEWSVRSQSDLEAMYGRLQDRYLVLSPLAALHRDGGGNGFSIRDAVGRTWRFSAGVARTDDHGAIATLPHKLSHIVLNSPDIERDVRFAIDELGFRQRDETKSMIFLGCNSDHHSLAFARIPSVSLNHLAFEVASIDAVMRNAGRLKRDGYPMQWGVGRHGPGANVYSYFLDPDELPIEYTAEMQQIDDGHYRPGSPSDWVRPPFYDAWGLAAPPSERFRNASGGIRQQAFAGRS